MFLYNLKQALIGLRQQPWLTLLMVVAIGIGIGIFMAAVTVVYQGNKVDLPDKSDRLFLVQLDSRSPAAETVNHFNDMTDLTYQDSINLHGQKNELSKTTFTWLTAHIVNMDNSTFKPYRAYSLVTTRDFFDILDIPFLYGSVWSQEAEDAGEPVIILTKIRNDYLFGGKNSVGKKIRINSHLVTVVGVIDDWHVRYRFYDRSFMQGLSDDSYLPYKFAMENNLTRNARFECWDSTNMDFQNARTAELIASECGWVTFWSLLRDKSDLPEYSSLLNRYVEDQKQLGRFPRPQGNFITSLDDVMAYVHSNNVNNRFYFIIGALFMAACVFSAVGVILAKFSRKTYEVSIRRALGAKRRVLLSQYVSEISLVGLMGGLLGILITYGTVHLMKLKTFHASSFYSDIGDLDKLFQLDWLMVVMAIVVAVVSAILIGIVPIWRVCQVQISQNLKIQ